MKLLKRDTINMLFKNRAIMEKFKMVLRFCLAIGILSFLLGFITVIFMWLKGGLDFIVPMWFNHWMFITIYFLAIIGILFLVPYCKDIWKIIKYGF